MRPTSLAALALMACGGGSADPLDVWQCVGGRPPAVRGSPAQVFFTDTGDLVWWNAAATGQRYLLDRATEAWQPFEPASGAEDLTTGTVPDGEACAEPADCVSGLCVPTDDAGVCLSPNQPLHHVITDGNQTWTAWLLDPPGGAPWRPVWLRRWVPEARAFVGTAVTPILSAHNRLESDQGLSGKVMSLPGGGALFRGIPSTPLTGMVNSDATAYTPIDDPAWAGVQHLTSAGGVRVVLRGGQSRETGVYALSGVNQPASAWTHLSDCGGPCDGVIALLSQDDLAYLVRQDGGVLRIDASGSAAVEPAPSARLQAAHLDTGGTLRVVGRDDSDPDQSGDAIWRLDDGAWWPEVRVIPEATHHFAPDGAVFRFHPDREELCVEVARP